MEPKFKEGKPWVCPKCGYRNNGFRKRCGDCEAGDIEIKVKYPNVTVELVGQDGNSIAIVNKVKKALKENNVPPEEVNDFVREALSGDRDHLLQTCLSWVNVE